MRRTGQPNISPVLIQWACVLLVSCLAKSTGGFADGLAPRAFSNAQHPISITQIDAFVTQSMLTMRCSFFADDLEFLYGVAPDPETGLLDREELLDAFDEHAEWLLEKVDVFNAAGERLTGRLVEKGPFDLPEQGVDSIRLMDFTLSLTYEFPLAEPPKLLTFRHDINDPNFIRPSEVKLVVKQSGSDQLYGSNMKGQIPETVRFDWENPLSKDADGDEMKDWYDRQHDETLGLANYGGVYSFVYVTNYETRHEVLVPVAILASEINFRQKDPYFIEVDEQQAAMEAIRKFYGEIATVTVNGEVRPPRFDRIEFGGLDIRDFAMTREPKRVSVANGRVGVIMSWSTRKLPDSVSVEWKHFNEKYMRTIDGVTITPGETKRHQYSMYLANNLWQWKNPGLPPLPAAVPVALDPEWLKPSPTPLPLLSLGLVAVALLIVLVSLLGSFRPRRLAIVLIPLFASAAILWPWKSEVRLPGSAPKAVSETEATGIFDKLIRNMFRAFDYSSEEDIYDCLATSVSNTPNTLLRELYLKMRKSLEVKEQGGAIATIENIQITSATLHDRPAKGTAGAGSLAPPGFAIRANWKIKGTVEHWGHIHQRTNIYDAVFNVQNVDNQWKITDYETLDEKQGPVSYGPRKIE
jgi:hypothetical protein